MINTQKLYQSYHIQTAENQRLRKHLEGTPYLQRKNKN